ncbi:hypothetical protein DFH28DRAFT_949820 [Melampsora americana]|nr:hypothetical protein DFH28DRAFT_949820 [Melampsora americana]
MKTKMRLSRTMSLPILILILVSPCFSHLEEDLELPLLADEVYNHYPTSDKGLILDLYSGEGGRKSLVPNQANRPNRIVATLCQKVEQLLASDSSTPKSAGPSNWKVYYEIAPKVLYQNHKIPEISALELDEHVMSCIKLAHIVLDDDSLGMRERIWVVGVLSCLESKIPMKTMQSTSEASDNTHQTFFRGRFELLLLQGWTLGDTLKAIWPESLKVTHYPAYAVLEALQRSALVDSIIKQIPESAKTSEEFEAILHLLVHLKMPIMKSNALELTKRIADQLKNMSNSPTSAGFFDERKAMIQFLLHLQENHLPSKIHFLEFAKDQDMASKTLKVDIGLEDTLSQDSKKVLHELLKNINKIDTQELIPALKKLTLENYTILQWRKILRVLDLANRQNPVFYQSLDEILSGSMTMTKRFANSLCEQYTEAQNFPGFFRSLGSHLLALISRKTEEFIAANRRKELENILISDGILLPQNIEPFHKALAWKFEGDRELELHNYLQQTFTEILSRREIWGALLATDPLVEYIINIICLKNNNERLLTWLSQRNLPRFRQISYHEFYKIKSSLKKSSDQTFGFRLQMFEKELSQVVEHKLRIMRIDQ